MLYAYRRRERLGGASSIEVYGVEGLSGDLAAEFAELFTPANTLGLGKEWTKEKAADIVKYAKEDASANPRRYWHFYISVDGVIAGYLGISPTKLPKYPSQLTIMVAKQFRGRGVAASAIKKLSRRKFGPVYAFVRFENDSSNAAMRKAGKYVGDENVFGSMHRVYLIKGAEK